MHLIHSKSIYLSKWASKSIFHGFICIKIDLNLFQSSLSVAVLVIFGVKKKGTHTLVFLSDDGFTASLVRKTKNLLTWGRRNEISIYYSNLNIIIK